MSRAVAVVVFWLACAGSCGDNARELPSDGGVDGPIDGPTGDGPPIDAMPDGPGPVEKLAQRAYAKATSPDSDDGFGNRVALSGDGQTLAVSADAEDSAALGIDGNALDNSAANAGAVYVFARTATGWKPQAYVKASNTGADDRFGISLALSADGAMLAVGARGEASAATGVDGDQQDDSAIDAGAVYVFTRRAGLWAQQAYLKASNADEGDNFGGQVAISADGTTLAVAAENEASSAIDVNGDELDDSAPLSGAVYVFTRAAAAWTQQAYIKASNTESEDFFGTTIALSGDGDTLAVTAPGESSSASGIDGDQLNDARPLSGAVYVFFRTDGNWKQQAYVKASNPDINDAFGRGLSLSASGSTLAIGATGEDSAATGANGDQADNSAASAGAVYVLQRAVDVWAQTAYLKAPNTGAGDLFGISVSLSGEGDVLAVGASGEDSAARGIDGNQIDETSSNSGALYVLKRSDDTWVPRSYVKASNADRSDLFGGCVSLSREGTTLAAGAAAEASAAPGTDGNQLDNSKARAGAAYVFR